MFKQLVPVLMGVVLVLLAVPSTTQAQVQYLSAPDRLYVFLNDIAYVEDTLELPGGVDVEVVLPGTVIVDTLVLRENDTRVPTYRVEYGSEGMIVRWSTADADSLRTVSMSYLANGISWQPKYDMVINAEDSVTFDFFAEVFNGWMNLDDVDLNLIAGRVDTSQQFESVSQITTNQVIVGYEAPAQAQVGTGAAIIQHVYPVGTVSAAPGETLYTQLTGGELSARRLYVWNASSDQQVTVIYKVLNNSEIPFAEGVVRSYQDGLFLGSDFIELTPISGEGSVTVGSLQDVRVFEEMTQQAASPISSDDTLNTISLEATNFGSEAVMIEIVHRYPSRAQNLELSDDATLEPGNLVRWIVIIEPGETITRSYSYITD